MKTSTSGSGIMLASFSLLDNSANISVKCQNFLELLITRVTYDSDGKCKESVHYSNHASIQPLGTWLRTPKFPLRSFLLCGDHVD